MKAVELVRAEGDRLPAGRRRRLGARRHEVHRRRRALPGQRPWDMLINWARVPANPLPLGCVLTLPATGSEMNGGAVISRESTKEKLFFDSPHDVPAVLDPRSRNDLHAAAAADGQRHRRCVCSHDRAIPDLSGRRPAARPPGRGDPADAARGRPEGAGRAAELRRAGEPDVVRHAGPQRPDRLRRAARLGHAHDRPRVDGPVRHRSRPIAGHRAPRRVAAPEVAQAGEAAPICRARVEAPPCRIARTKTPAQNRSGRSTAPTQFFRSWASAPGWPITTFRREKPIETCVGQAAGANARTVKLGEHRRDYAKRKPNAE